MAAKQTSKAAPKAKKDASVDDDTPVQDSDPDTWKGSEAASTDPVAHQYDNDPVTPEQPEVSSDWRAQGADPRENEFVNVVSGPEKGRYGVYVQTNTRDKDGRPEKITISTRDDDAMLLGVDYDDCERTLAGHR